MNDLCWCCGQAHCRCYITGLAWSVDGKACQTHCRVRRSDGTIAEDADIYVGDFRDGYGAAVDIREMKEKRDDR